MCSSSRSRIIWEPNSHLLMYTTAVSLDSYSAQIVGCVRHTNTDNGPYNDEMHNLFAMTVDTNMCLYWTVFFKKKYVL
jgi:hypothetical protein